MQIIKELSFLLSSQELKKASLLVIMMIVVAILDMIGVASILPFVAVLSNPSLIETNFFLIKMFKISNEFGVNSSQQFLFVLGILVFVLLIVSLILKALTSYLQARFVNMREYSIAKRVVELYLNQPYSWFLSRHSSEIGKTILSEVGLIVGGILQPLMELISKGLVAIALIILLIIADPKLSLIIGISLSLAYFLIFYFLHKYLDRIGKESLKNNELRFIAIGEAFGAVKEIKVGSLEETYIKNFSYPAQIFARVRAFAVVVAQLPRFFLEAIAFGGILLIILFIMTQTGSFNHALPIISLYVFAGYRLIPALQSIYAAFTKLTFTAPSLDKLYQDIIKLKLPKESQQQDLILFNETITLRNVCYSYPNTTRTALKDISLSIPVRSTIGLVGPTGSGKTTVVDIILGLLEPQKGTLEIDGKVVTKKNSKSWQRSIGYVPQNIYLADDSIASNIAFGIKSADINHAVVEKVSKIANLHEFVFKELPEKYQTKIGERGVRLSGGQRQRIGIARALYHDPKILILDEATSALDNQTEKEVMSAIENLKKNITTILIAHRLNTVKNCDKIILLEKGKIKNEMTFNELININKNKS
jgi:ABC-type bacteriocin/lantibiotic exporter with double-glycine peptidase domain